MATTQAYSGGIQVPIEASSTGGIRLLSGDGYIRQLVETLCGDGESDNPFNTDVGIGASAIFQNSGDVAWRAKSRNEITKVFQDLQRANLAKLRNVELTPSPGSAEEFDARIEFLSIETNTTLEVDTTLRRS